MILIILKTLPFLPFLLFLSKMNNFMQQLLSKKRRKSGKKLFLVFYEELTKNNNQFQQNSFWMHEKQSQIIIIIYPATFSFQDHNIRKRIWFINWFSNFISPHRYPPQICNTTSRLVIKINSNSTRFTHTHVLIVSRLLFSIWDPMKSTTTTRTTTLGRKYPMETNLREKRNVNE